MLPFRNQSQDVADGFLADGVTRDLTMLLSRVPRLRVAAYSSAQTAKEGEDRFAADYRTARRALCRLRLACPARREFPAARRTDGRGRRRPALGAADRCASRPVLRGAGQGPCWTCRPRSPRRSTFRTLRRSGGAARSSSMPISSCSGPRRCGSTTIAKLRRRSSTCSSRRWWPIPRTARSMPPWLCNTRRTSPASSAIPRRRHSRWRRSTSIPGLALAPHDPEVLAAAGITASMMGNARLAVRKLQEAVALDPNNPHPLAVLGWQYCWLHGDPAGREMIEIGGGTRAASSALFGLGALSRTLRNSPWPGGGGDRRLSRRRGAQSGLQPQSGDARRGRGAGGEDGGRARGTLARLHTIASDYELEDYVRLARRMVYWFGENPTLEEAIAALRGAWETASIT